MVSYCQQEGQKVLFPSALISCAVVLSLENCPGCGLLGKALGLRKELSPCLLYPAWMHLLPYVGRVYTFSFVQGCMWLKSFHVSQLKCVRFWNCFLWAHWVFRKKLYVMFDWLWHFLWIPFLILARKQAAVCPIVKLLSLSTLQGAGVCNSTPCKSAPYTQCWNAWISWLKSLDCTIKNFTSLWTDGGSESTIQKLNTRKNAACFAMAAWPSPCIKCFWVLQNDLTLFFPKFAEAMQDEKHWLSYFLLFVLNFFTANVDSTVHFKAMAYTWHFLYKFCSLRLLKFLCGMTNNILIKSSFLLRGDSLWRLVLLALFEWVLQLTFLHS